ncbi:MAG TPA: hypothetical protein VGC41_13065 [Kofleriaceae bacterium]
MRRAVILLVSATAFAAPADKKQKPLDIKAQLPNLEVWKDDLNQFYVVPTSGIPDSDEAGKLVFFGDAKNQYQQRIVGSGSTKGHYEWTVWSPRVTTQTHASLEYKDDRLILQCGVKDIRPLTQLKADEAKAFFAKATFQTALWNRHAHFLARDDDGVYYYVDVLSDEAGGNGHRVFVGQKGAMKEQAMTNVVEDSGGSIFATKSGNLKIVANKTSQAYWVRGGKKVELTLLDVSDNRYLIYRGLGLYGQMGVPCDDL